MDMSRRGFVGALGSAALAVPAMALADESSNALLEEQQRNLGAATDVQVAVPAEIVEQTGWSGSPAAVLELGQSTMLLSALNLYRKAYVDAQTEFTCSDGTVVPAVYVKLYALVNSYGQGLGNTPWDGTFAGVMKVFTEEDAQLYLDMPWGVKFTAIDFYEKTGRSLEECTAILDRFADEGFIARFEANDGITYNHVPFFQGVTEYQMPKIVADATWDIGLTGIDYLTGQMTGGTPVFYAMPCDISVVAGETILPHDDAEAIIRSKGENGKFAIAPCYCRYTALTKGGVEGVPTFEDFASGEFEEYFSPLCDQRVETCLMMGDEADYWVYHGIARYVSMDDALRYMKRSRDDGFILQSCFTKNTETICSCHHASCGILATWKYLGDPATVASATGFAQISHYDLAVDLDACSKCGTCAARCPVPSITMDEETGYSVVDEMCFRCGQCAYVCPMGARKLVERDASLNAELPRDFLADANMKAAYRFEKGLIQ